MTTRVRDIMNPQLLYLLGDERAEAARAKLLHFEVSGAPVLDAQNRPVGFVSLRDFALDGKSFHTSCPVQTVSASEAVESAARRLAELEVRRLVVVDERGVAVGMVSALDFVRALTGLAPRHPKRFDAECTSGDAFPDDLDG
jgi:CBS domain-containing protein